MLFGYGDGEIKHIDIRAGSKNHVYVWPIVGCLTRVLTRFSPLVLVSNRFVTRSLIVSARSNIRSLRISDKTRLWLPASQSMCIDRHNASIWTHPRVVLRSFTVWRHNSSSQLDSEATVWSHASPSPNPLINTSGSLTNGTYWSDTSIVISNSSGFLEVYDQKFL